MRGGACSSQVYPAFRYSSEGQPRGFNPWLLFTGRVLQCGRKHLPHGDASVRPWSNMAVSSVPSWPTGVVSIRSTSIWQGDEGMCKRDIRKFAGDYKITARYAMICDPWKLWRIIGIGPKNIRVVRDGVEHVVPHRLVIQVL